MPQPNRFDPCPCTSQKPYHKCCQIFHKGEAPTNALLLMRSRFCAYAIGLSDYIIDTTHEENASYNPNRDAWKRDIEQFSVATKFDGLKIVEFNDGDKSATVTFTAYLRQGDSNATFTERSGFVKENGKWFYRSGEINSSDTNESESS